MFGNLNLRINTHRNVWRTKDSPCDKQVKTES